MMSILKLLRLVADPSRTRIVLLLEQEELSVAELQEILGMGQSTLSTHLAQLKQAGMLEDRRTGKNIFYRLKERNGGEHGPIDQLMGVLRQAAEQLPGAEADMAALRLIRLKRRDRVRAYFDELAGKFGRKYVPGRSWKGLAETLLLLLPPLVIADLGAGEGTVSQLLARRAKEVIAVDNSEKMVAFGSALARKHGVRNLHYRKGDLEALPIEDGAVDVAFFSQSLHHAQHPECAVAEAFRILKAGGRIIVLDLVRHHCEEARELYADLWLGFTEVEVQRLLRKAGFKDVSTAVVHRESKAPHFETMLAAGDR
ncbi:MAG: metalloregulator ArsR/SmtB family transcription factor [Acidobacteriia bacterium]|nr:metalloregulator ArsR/SmtB family transcription factor [Terriglobia bacterium]